MQAFPVLGRACDILVQVQLAGDEGSARTRLKANAEEAKSRGVGCSETVMPVANLEQQS